MRQLRNRGCSAERANGAGGMAEEGEVSAKRTGDGRDVLELARHLKPRRRVAGGHASVHGSDREVTVEMLAHHFPGVVRAGGAVHDQQRSAVTARPHGYFRAVVGPNFVSLRAHDHLRFEVFLSTDRASIGGGIWRFALTYMLQTVRKYRE